jgi:metal-responsive CopG/Arc/MetJ family transcriptional regulator
MNDEKGRKLPIGIAIPLRLLEKIDSLRGKKSRSEFVVKLIEEALET